MAVTVPAGRIVSIEHPCIVKNFDKGFKSLGGEAQLKHVLEHRVGDSTIKVNDRTHVFPDPVVGVSLRPDDPLAKRMPSIGVATRNVLMRITLPKWTGRKRKRGSDEPFTGYPDDAPTSKSIRAPDLLRRLQDNAGGYKVESLGMIRETHRFRGQPDFQMQTGNIAAMQQVKPLAGQPSYDTLKDFKIDVSHGVAGNDDFPLPPSLTAIEQPYQYQYVQAPYVVYTEAADGTLTSTNTYGSHRRILEPQAIDVEVVPKAPPPDLRLYGKNNPEVKRAIEALQKLLADRPIATKRVIANVLHEFSDDVWKEATQWVGYMFSAGPWRDCLVRYGVDPRTDPIYRKYQPLMFQLDRKTLGITDNRPATYRGLDAREDTHTSHIFDGETMPANVKTFQVCDVTDSLLRKILDTDELPDRCDIHANGWYHSGTLAKVRVIMREKARCLLTGQELAHADYEVVAKAPDDIHSAAGEAFLAEWKHREHGKKVQEMMQDWRNTTRQSAKRIRFLVPGDEKEGRSEQGTPVVAEEGEGAGGESSLGTPAGTDQGDVENEESTPGTPAVVEEGDRGATHATHSEQEMADD